MLLCFDNAGTRVCLQRCGRSLALAKKGALKGETSVGSDEGTDTIWAQKQPRAQTGNRYVMYKNARLFGKRNRTKRANVISKERASALCLVAVRKGVGIWICEPSRFFRPQGKGDLRWTMCCDDPQCALIPEQQLIVFTVIRLRQSGFSSLNVSPASFFSFFSFFFS